MAKQSTLEDRIKQFSENDQGLKRSRPWLGKCTPEQRAEIEELRKRWQEKDPALEGWSAMALVRFINQTLGVKVGKDAIYRFLGE